MAGPYGAEVPGNAAQLHPRQVRKSRIMLCVLVENLKVFTFKVLFGMEVKGRRSWHSWLRWSALVLVVLIPRVDITRMVDILRCNTDTKGNECPMSITIACCTWARRWRKAMAIGGIGRSVSWHWRTTRMRSWQTSAGRLLASSILDCFGSSAAPAGFRWKDDIAAANFARRQTRLVVLHSHIDRHTLVPLSHPPNTCRPL